MNRNRPLEDDLARDTLTEFLNRQADADTFLTFRHYRIPVFDTVFDSTEGWTIEQVGYSAHGGVTFCVVAEPDSEFLYVSVAECSDKDLFNKNLGREVSLGRFARVAQYYTLRWNREKSIAENLEDVWYIFGLRNSLDEVELSVKSRFIEA